MNSFCTSHSWDYLDPSDFEELENPKIKQAGDILFDLMNIFYDPKSRFDEDDIRDTFIALAKSLNVSECELPSNEIQVVCKKKHAWEVYNKCIEAKENKAFVTRHVKQLHNEIYGDDALDYFNVAGSMANLLWNCGIEDVKTPKKMNIQRKV